MKIAILGPESSGKSVLSEAMAAALNCPFVPEFARQYLTLLKNPYQSEDLVKMAKGQIDLWKSFNDHDSFISDTEMITLKIWSLEKYGMCDDFILKALQEQTFDLYLLCEPDLPWTYDVLREVPGQKERDQLFEWYKKELTTNQLTYELISGDGSKRLEMALKAVRKHRSIEDS